MTWRDLEQAASVYAPALCLYNVYPHETRLVVLRGVMFGTVGLLLLTVVLYAFGASGLGTLPGFSLVSGLGSRVYGLFLLVFSVAFVLTALEAFHNSYYFRGLDHVLQEPRRGEVPKLSFEVATIVAGSDADNITDGFLRSPYGQEILYRTGITEEAYVERLEKNQSQRTTQSVPFLLDDGTFVQLVAYTQALLRHDASLRQWLLECGTNEQELLQAAGWVMRMEHGLRERKRWWSRDNLGRVPGLGKSWSYGETYRLKKYGHELTEDPMYAAAVERAILEHDEVVALEAILARDRQANALLIGKEGSGMRQKVAQLYHKIREGVCLPQLESKQVFLFDMEALVAAKQEKGAFEAELIAVLNEVVHAGNIILYLENIGASITSAAQLGVDIVELLSPYFGSAGVQLIASCDDDGYNRRLSRDNRIMEYFEIVRMQDIDQSALLLVLEQRAASLEDRYGVTFTVGALAAVARDAERYFPDGVMPDKAFDLLEELIPRAVAAGVLLVGVSLVDAQVREKTGVPIGAPTEAERSQLLDLESFLHARVVGQDTAVTGVAKALRRARSGVGGAEKPMGSFLFLGPTGVGKTETAKALAEALFGNEDALMRLDMSEFQGESALAAILGSEQTGAPGRLPTLLRERQYGVLLLDEFEKSDRSVHDLFLQVLDEGQFTDATGRTVNARNLVIIATSNAGAQHIWEWSKAGEDVSTKKTELIDVLVSDGMFRPEFLNRFDDVVVFHPLGREHIAKIARMQLANLAKRLQDEKGIALEVNDELVAAIALIGYDPKFGGRPMQRAIKDSVEQAVADRILAGTLAAGGRVVLTKEDVLQ